MSFGADISALPTATSTDDCGTSGLLHTTPHSHMTTNGKALSAIKPSTSSVIKRQRQNLLDVPSDDYFIATEETSITEENSTTLKLGTQSYISYAHELSH
ncbi:hypothetical protein KIL84_016833 [Mauremys mutica]|uniref:Uncharacterized protein n=1 Tax=Mauremys mutica TaxID=74926 RepID=A0A9D4AWU2_9SAUR|nr:hypothetical protein KIL84_016833 [Mauremys mutica]